jgi:hypothetical protein
MTLYLVAGVLFVVGLISYFRYTISYSKRMVHVGLTAAQTYIMFDDTAAFCAARTICASVSKSHKEQLVSMFRSIPTVGEGFDEAAAKDRLSILIFKAISDGSGISSSVSLKQELKEKSEEWLEATMKADLDLADKLYKEGVLKNVMNSLGKK